MGSPQCGPCGKRIAEDDGCTGIEMVYHGQGIATHSMRRVILPARRCLAKSANIHRNYAVSSALQGGAQQAILRPQITHSRKCQNQRTIAARVVIRDAATVTFKELRLCGGC